MTDTLIIGGVSGLRIAPGTPVRVEGLGFFDEGPPFLLCALQHTAWTVICNQKNGTDWIEANKQAEGWYRAYENVTRG